MQDLTRYALERHIQLVPQIQAPSHMNWLLKHKEYEHLQADSSNYHMCMCDEEGMQVIRDLYQDMIEATPGVKYFHASTDEIYYAGICDKCQREYNEQNRSLYWVEYVNWMHKWLTERGRTMLCWVEYPLLPEHIRLLPSGLIDAINCLYAGGPQCAWEAEGGLWPHQDWYVDFSADGVRSYMYQVCSLQDGPTLIAFCHENGHMLCEWPDLYDRDFDSDGVGRYCLMGGYASGDETSPFHPCAYLKCLSNWATVTALTTPQTGLTITADILAGGPLTGAAMNPARAFGPALLSGSWDDHLTWWIGPIIGGVVAGLLYHYVFSEEAN